MEEYTEDELLLYGLRLVYARNPDRLSRCSRDRNVQRFNTFFGASPTVYVKIWNDLQTTTIPEARVEPKDLDLTYFFMSLHFLKCYPLEDEREALFDISPKTGREKVWFWVEKIYALRGLKIFWTYEAFEDEIWALTVDGTHCEFREPSHPEFRLNTGYNSHKKGQAGLAYEIGISLFESQVVWVNGPFRAGMNDLSIFCSDGGLKDWLELNEVKAIGDNGYPGHANVVSTFNAMDDDDVKIFKSRALLRQETFNGHLKNFRSLAVEFRHSEERFKHVFEAIVVICQYKIETDVPLFDIYIDALNPKASTHSISKLDYRYISYHGGTQGRMGKV